METVFIESLGYGIGSSTVEKGRLDQARMLWGKIDSAGVRLLLPTDLVVAQKLEAGSDTKIVAIDRIPDGWVIADIGPQTIEAFAKELDRCRTVFWNGPMGVFELPPFAKGTRAMAEVMSKLTGATTVIGGGSTAQAVSEMGFADKMSFISTGGGASLELLQGKVLPGVDVLLDA
jgi:3-phosphoglycerate kinase